MKLTEQRLRQLIRNKAEFAVRIENEEIATKIQEIAFSENCYWGDGDNSVCHYHGVDVYVIKFNTGCETYRFCRTVDLENVYKFYPHTIYTKFVGNNSFVINCDTEAFGALQDGYTLCCGTIEVKLVDDNLVCNNPAYRIMNFKGFKAMKEVVVQYTIDDLEEILGHKIEIIE